MRMLDTHEAAKLAQLTRVKILATAVLLLCFVVMVAAKILEHHYPAFGIVAAFAEAATIGGIADWFAVVALFKHPLNLPFPHTAIIPRNQPRIADNLGQFIKNNFLAEEPIRGKLREVDFSREIAGWLSQRDRALGLAGFAIKFVPQLLENLDDQALRHAATRQISTEIRKTDVAPLLGNVIETFTQNGRHQKLLDDLIHALHRFLNDTDTLQILRSKIKRELPVLFNVAGGDVAVLNRIIKAATELLYEVKDDSDHPMRVEFEGFLLSYMERTRHSKGFALQVERMKRLILERPELEAAVDQLWAAFRGHILNDIAQDDSILLNRLTDLLVDLAASLEDRPDLQRDINDALARVVATVVADQRDGIATFVSDQVKAWDMQQLLQLIEANVGRDLQFIRFNGMLIGGVVGVMLYLAETLLL